MDREPEPELARTSLPADDRAEQIVYGFARSPTAPRPRECLLCYVDRMLAQFGCHDQLRFAARYRDLMAPRASRLERRLGAVGGFCDCEIFVNGYAPAHHLWSPERVVEGEDGFAEVTNAEPPEVMPECSGVRSGSTRPCDLWVRRGAVMW